MSKSGRFVPLYSAMRGKRVWIGIKGVDWGSPVVSTGLKGLCEEMGLKWETVRKRVGDDMSGGWAIYRGEDGELVRVTEVEVKKVRGRGGSRKGVK